MRPITVLTAVCLFLSCVSHKTLAASLCERRLIFVPQIHAPSERHFDVSQVSEKERAEQKEKAVKSQLAIAQFIEDNPNTPIFSEQAGDESFTMDVLEPDQKASLEAHYRDVFPNGLPKTYGELTETQKDKFFENGADFVQLIRGKTSTIHKVAASSARYNQIFDVIEAWFATEPDIDDNYPYEVALQVYAEREKEALRAVNEFFEAHPNKLQAIIIFGANHRFDYYPEIFPSNCISIPTEFRENWSGESRDGPHGFFVHRKPDEPTDGPTSIRK